MATSSTRTTNRTVYVRGPKGRRVPVRVTTRIRVTR